MKFGLCIEMAFNRLPFEQRLAEAAKAGLEHVEMWFADASYKGSPQDLAAMAKRYGVQITNTVIAASDGSIGGGLTDPRRREEWLARARMTIEFNKAAGIPATIVCTGNVVPGMSDEAMYASVVDGLKATLPLAEKAGVTLLLEQLNTRKDHAGYWLSSSDRSAEICRRIGSPYLRMLFDCYHMQIMEGDLLTHIRAHLDLIGHFHSAGVPGRHELYDGEVNYRFLARAIEDLGYKGVFSMEYAPTMDHAESVRKTLAYLKD